MNVNHYEIDNLASKVADLALGRADFSKRFVLGITGPPASGKSTLAEELVSRLNTLRKEFAQIAPMDGFHYYNDELKKMKLEDSKGAPETFNVKQYSQLLRKLRASEIASAPSYSRVTHNPVEDSFEFRSEAVVVSEGNYLLLDNTEWKTLPTLFDSVFYLKANWEEIYPRLIKRQINRTRDPILAEKHVMEVDLPNFHIIEETALRADEIIKVQYPPGYFNLERSYDRDLGQ